VATNEADSWEDGAFWDAAQPELWSDPEHASWADKWAPPCPIGNAQRVRECTGYREREPGRLQLRVPMRGDEGACQVVIDEHPDKVVVRVLLCYEDEPGRRDSEYRSVPVHVCLDQPLAGRAVIDYQTGQALPLYVPDW
jgi:hypothetical protein